MACAALAALSRGIPRSAKDVRRADYSVSTAWRTSPRPRSRGRCVATVSPRRARTGPRTRTARASAARFFACVPQRRRAHREGRRAPDPDDSPRTRFLGGAACAFAAVPAEWRLADDALAAADERLCWHRDAGTPLGVALVTTRAAALFGRRHDDETSAALLDLLLDPLLDPSDPESGDARDGDASNRGPQTRSALGSLLRLSAPDAPLLSVAFVFLVLYAVAAASVPHFTGELVDAVAIDRDPAAFKKYSACLLVAALAAGVFAGARGSIFTVQMARLNARVRGKLFDSLLAQDGGFFDTHKTGDLSSRLNNDCSVVSNALSLNINVAARNLVNALGVLAFMFALSWPLTLVTLASLPPTLLVSKVYGRYFKQISKKTQKALAEATTVAEETLSSVFTVRAFAGEPFASRDFRDRLAEFKRQNAREAQYVVTYTFCLTATPMLVTVLVLWYGGMLVLRGELNPGALVSFMLYQQQLTSCFSAVADVFTAVTTALGAAEKVLELIASKPAFDTWPLSARSRRETVAEPTLDGRAEPVARPSSCEGFLELEDVTFAYPSRPEKLVLRGVSLKVNAGETVAFIGPSGGGKSSIVNLIERFYRPTSGRVLLDGNDIATLHPRWFKRRVAIVAQEPALFDRSVRRNIVFGLEKGRYLLASSGETASTSRGASSARSDASRFEPLGALLEEDEDEPSSDEVVAAAVAANAHEFITRLPRGYESTVGGAARPSRGAEAARRHRARARASTCRAAPGRGDVRAGRRERARQCRRRSSAR